MLYNHETYLRGSINPEVNYTKFNIDMQWGSEYLLVSNGQNRPIHQMAVNLIPIRLADPCYFVNQMAVYWDVK